MNEKPIVSDELLTDRHAQDLAHLIFSLRMISHIPILFYVNGKVLGTETLHDIVLPSEIEQPLLCDSSIALQLHNNAQNYPTIQEETTSIYYCTLKYKSDVTCILGPLYTNFLSKSELHAYMHCHHMHNYQNYRIHSATHQEALALMTVVDYIISGNLTPTASTTNTGIPAAMNLGENVASSLSDYLRQNYRLNTEQHMPYFYEQQLYEYVRKGDYESFIKFSTEQMPISNYTLGEVSQSELRQREYYAVTQIALFRHTAIESGVNPYDAYDLSDMLLQRLSSKQTLDNYEKVQMDCVKLFFTAIKKAHSITSSSMHIEKCKYYISKHLRKPFTIPDIADYIGLSTNYLENLFSLHEPCTLKQYIIQERLNAAKNMLKYSDFTISEIAHSLCFQNQSYFGVLFKKKTGLTPAQFRKVNKPQNF